MNADYDKHREAGPGHGLGEQPEVRVRKALPVFIEFFTAPLLGRTPIPTIPTARGENSRSMRH